MLAGCSFDTHAGKRPRDYPNTVWICNDPKISLFVSKDHDDSLIIDEEYTELHGALKTGFGKARMDVVGDDGLLFQCKCSFYEDRFVGTVTEDRLFDGEYLGKTITFYRHDLQQEQTEDGSLNVD